MITRLAVFALILFLTANEGLQAQTDGPVPQPQPPTAKSAAPDTKIFAPTLVRITLTTHYDLYVWWENNWITVARTGKWSDEWRGTVDVIHSRATGFLVETDDGLVVVTAAHAFVPERNPKMIPRKNNDGKVVEEIWIDNHHKQIHGVRSTIRVSAFP